MLRRGTEARLFLEGKCVGTVVAEECHESWGFGQFRPNAAFSEFASVYGSWSLLMHEDEQQRLSRAASEELNRVERSMDSIHAKLLDPETGAWYPVAQLNIDGPLVEWKEF